MEERKVFILDYGMGNLKSVYNALKFLGGEPILVSSAEQLEDGKIVIPGVGAFGKAMQSLSSFVPKIRKTLSSGAPVLGICLGLQVLLESSEEAPDVKGIGVIKGKVVKIKSMGLPLPHIGWNYVSLHKGSCPLFRGLGESYAYFVHSYHALPKEDVIVATTYYGERITAAVWKDNLFGVQFHPEKSGRYGLKILKNFLELRW
jgi:glutamine amidotransferase